MQNWFWLSVFLFVEVIIHRRRQQSLQKLQSWRGWLRHQRIRVRWLMSDVSSSLIATFTASWVIYNSCLVSLYCIMHLFVLRIMVIVVIIFSASLCCCLGPQFMLNSFQLSVTSKGIESFWSQKLGGQGRKVTHTPHNSYWSRSQGYTHPIQLLLVKVARLHAPHITPIGQGRKVTRTPHNSYWSNLQKIVALKSCCAHEIFRQSITRSLRRR